MSANRTGPAGDILRRVRRALTPPDPSFDPRATRRLARFAARLPAHARILDLGCGERLSLPRAVGVDLHRSHVTVCVADALCLPFADASFDGATSFAVFEHVADPWRAAAELRRVLKPGAPVLIVAPFLQGHHPPCGTDTDYWRFTIPGLRRLCECFEEEDVGVATGPMSALAWVLREIAAAPLASRPYAVKPVRFVAGWITAGLKLLDAVAVYFPGAPRVASSLYFLGRTPGR